jgi:cellulose synthase/poly-beta-1,6-N-acetylglucosamine synthase-like glycosyltransferase
MSISQFVVSGTDILLLVSSSILLIICLFFLIECIAALFPNSSAVDRGNWQNTKVAVLVPAHNEEIVIRSTLEKLIPELKKQDRLLVVADNCHDATAEIARAMGAIVIERHDVDKKGKGYALDYGLQFLESDPPDVVVIVDADCTVNQGTIEQLSDFAITTQRPVQATYLMARAENSQSSKDFISQFANIIRNLVRPRGLDNLGFPSLLFGTGMAFSWSVIRAVNLASGHLIEDFKLGLDLTLAGHKPMFCPAARVTGYLPTSAQAAKSQKTRWVHGHFQIMQAYIPLLVKEAWQQKRFDLLVSALDLLVPPLSLLAVSWLAMIASSLLWVILTASWTGAAIATAAGLCFITAIIAAWAKFAAQELPLKKLLTIPVYILWKIPVYLQFLIKPQTAWVRTERDKLS